MDADQSPEAEFREALRCYDQYPEEESLCSYLFPTDEIGDKVKGYARHFRDNATKLFSKPEKPEKPGKRSTTCVPIRDFRSGGPGTRSYVAKFHTIRKREDLHNMAGIGYRSEPGSPPPAFPEDPLCRIILLERQGWVNQLMNVDKDMLYLILTYHQVHPCYLNFLTCCGTKPTTGASDVGFSGFRSYVSPGAAAQSDTGELVAHSIESLGRSGQHYQLCLKLESVRRDYAASTANVLGQPEPSVYKPMAAAVYHQFDVGMGTSLWIISNPLENIPPSSSETLIRGHRDNFLWKDIQKRMALKDYYVVDGNPGKRFQASLDVVHLLCEWSVGDMDYHLNHLDITFDSIARKYINGLARFDGDGQILEEDLRMMSQTLMDLQHCRIVTEDNMRVLKHLRKFYTGLPASLISLKLEWQKDVQTGVTELDKRLEPISARIESILERIEVLERLTGSRADSIQKHIENATNKAMTKLTIVTSDDSSAMRVFAFITLVLLPVTVVSTVMSMNMIQFNDMPDRSVGGGGGGDGGGSNSTTDHTDEPPYDFSWLMFRTWIAASLILTFICIAFSWTWAEVARLKREKEKTFRELIFSGKAEKQHLPREPGTGRRPSRGEAEEGGSGSSVLPTAIGRAFSRKWAELARLRRKKGGGGGGLRGLVLPRWWTKSEPQSGQPIIGNSLGRDSNNNNNNFSSSGGSDAAHNRNGNQPEGPFVTGALGYGATASFTSRRGIGGPPQLSTALVSETSPALATSSTAVGSSAPLRPPSRGGHVRSGSSVSQYSDRPFCSDGHDFGQDSPA